MINQGAKSMIMECDCGKTYTGGERNAKFWYKIHGKVCIQAHRKLPLFMNTIIGTDETKILDSLRGANIVETLKIIETHNIIK